MKGTRLVSRIVGDIMTSACIFWVIAAVVFGIIEGATVALVTIWFALGAVAAAVAAQLGFSPVAQVGTFVIVSALFLCVTRPVLKKIAVKDPQKTNADRFIGGIGIVTEPIDGINSSGQVKVGGSVWSAVSESGVIEKGEKVEVIRISGVRLVVRPAERGVI